MAREEALERRESYGGGWQSMNRISWGAILLGVACTLALGFMLLFLGAAIGLGSINTVTGQVGRGAAIGSGIYAFLAILASCFAGGVVASRCSRLSARRDGAATGLGVWACSFLASLFLLTSAIGGLAGGALGLTGQALQGAGTAAQGRVLTPEQQAQVQQQLPSGPEVQERMGEIAGGAANVGASAGWGLFFTGLFSALAAVVGGIVGLPKSLRSKKGLEFRRERGTALREERVVRPSERYESTTPETRVTRDTSMFRREEELSPPSPHERH